MDALKTPCKESMLRKSTCVKYSIEGWHIKVNISDDEPTFFEEATRDSKWEDAMDEEMALSDEMGIGALS